MIGDWVAQWPALLAALAVFYLPGLALVAALRIRGFALWALAPVASTAALAVLAITYGIVGITWSPLSAAIGCSVLVVVTILSAIGLGPGNRPLRTRTGERWVIAAGLIVGIVLGGLRLGFYVGTPDAISQTNDAVFHLNALRYVIETGSASSLDLTGLLGGTSFYPAAWHALTSLVVLLSGSTIPVAANLVAAVIAVVIWPVSITWMTSVVARSVPATALAAGLSPALLAFPMLMLEWGVLYPYALAVALVPAVAASVIVIPSWIAGRGPVAGVARNAAVAGVAVVAGLGALALAQPAVILAWAILVVVWFSWWAAQALRRGEGRRGRLVAALAAAWIAFALVWVGLTLGTVGSHWGPFSGRLEAAIDLALNGPVMLPYSVGVSILLALGIVVAVWRAPLRWLATSWVVFAALYFVAAAVGQPFLRRLLVGGWYADPYRLAALLPLTVVPLAAIGLSAVAVWAGRAISGRRTESTPTQATGWSLAAVAAIGAIALVVAPVVQMPRIIEREPDASSRYTSDDLSYLSPDERKLLAELDALVDADARIIGNPSTGMGFGYMLSGRDVYPRTWAVPRTPEWAVLADGLVDAATDPAVCQALDTLGDPEYVLDFGPGEASPGRFIIPAMTGFASHDGFELVAQRGEASLWRITACG